ncbi:MAG: hypothetical protein LH466_09780, partial [Sphingomonas bacterium]|nr:hypothetical protein [Sphingomonas bacterium]
ASFEQLLHRDDGSRHRIVSFRLFLGQRLKPVLRPAPVWWPCLWDGAQLNHSLLDIKGMGAARSLKEQTSNISA